MKWNIISVVNISCLAMKCYFVETGNCLFTLNIMLYLFNSVFCGSRDLAKVYDELGGRSFHLKRKTKQHTHHHTNILNSTSFLRGLNNIEQTKNGEDNSYSLRSTSYAYVMELELGTPPQRLEFLIDTGSANMAIAGPECRDEHGIRCKIDNFYFPSESSTSKRIGHPVETEYGKGSWSGDVYKDVVSFPNGPSLVAEFAVIKNQKEFFIKNSVNEGILGLAYKSLSSSPIEPLYDQLVHEKKVPDVFSLSLCNGNGRFWLDYPKNNEYHHPIFWTNIIHRAWYTVRMTGVDVGGESLGLSPYSYPPAIVDSGTTDILLEPEIYIAVIAMLKKNGPAVDDRFWNNYCVMTDPYKWPYITVYLKDMRGGSFALTILGKHYVRKQDQFFCLSIGAKQFGAVLGEVTLEGNVVVFDRANHRIGFAPSNLTDPESGSSCGNPTIINTTVSGSLKDFCKATFMPRVSCHATCSRCVEYNGAWCPRGRIYIWINGVRSALDGSTGFCWLGNFYSFESTRYQTYLEGHGSVEFELECFSVLPMYKQCTLRGEWLFVIIMIISFSSTILCICLCCKRVYEADSGDDYPIYNTKSSNEPYPIHNSLRDRTVR